jgi:hypothetical protein
MEEGLSVCHLTNLFLKNNKGPASLYLDHIGHG